MIEVAIYYKNNKINAFHLTGHADSGPYGYDLVCAGVSAVSFGSINAVLSLCKVDLMIEQKGDGGYLKVVIPDDLEQDKSEKVNLLFEAMIVSLQSIEREYRDHIKITKYKGGESPC